MSTAYSKCIFVPDSASSCSLKIQVSACMPCHFLTCAIQVDSFKVQFNWLSLWRATLELVVAGILCLPAIQLRIYAVFSSAVWLLNFDRTVGETEQVTEPLWLVKSLSSLRKSKVHFHLHVLVCFVLLRVFQGIQLRWLVVVVTFPGKTDHIC